MRVLVAGATGAIGRPLVERLVQSGHHVIATTRAPDNAQSVRKLGATAMLMDGLDAASVGETVARAEPDAIIHQMTALAGKPDLRHFDRWFAKTNELRTTGTPVRATSVNALATARGMLPLPTPAITIPRAPFEMQDSMRSAGMPA